MLRERKQMQNSVAQYILILLFCMNFLGRGSIFCFVYAILSLIKTKRIRFDACSLFCFAFTVVSALTSWFYWGVSEAIKCLNFFLIYLSGLNGYYEAEDKGEYIKGIIFTIFLGYAIYIVLTFFYNLKIERNGYRILYNIWSGELVAVTQISLCSSVIIGYSIYAIAKRSHWKSKIVPFAALIVTLILNTITATRTPFLLFILVSFFIGIVYLATHGKKKLFSSIVAIGLVCLIGVAALKANLFGVADRLESISIVSRFLSDGIKTGRTSIIIEHFKYSTSYIWGGGKIEALTGRMAHNYVQQAHDRYGWLATVSVLLITVCFINNIFKIAKKKEKKEIDYLLLSMYAALFVQSLLEPVFTGYPCFFFALLFIHGAASAYLKSGERKLVNDARIEPITQGVCD